MVGSPIVVRRRLTSLVTSLFVVMAPIATRADTPSGPDGAPGPEESINQKIAVWRFDALGIDPELVALLETLFRMELDRLDKQPLPTRREMERLITGEQKECTG